MHCRAPSTAVRSTLFTRRCNVRWLALSSHLQGIPVIDFSAMVGPHANDATKAACAAEVYDAFHNVGFAALVNHSIPKTLMRKAFAASTEFFALPGDVKEKYNWTTPTANRGYLGMGKEKLAYGKVGHDYTCQCTYETPGVQIPVVARAAGWVRCALHFSDCSCLLSWLYVALR